jgi:hypothetical protein
MLRDFQLVILIIILSVVAVVALFFPKKMQSYAIRTVNKGVTARIRVLVAYVSSPGYLITLRITGAAVLATLAALIYLAIVARHRG